MPLQVPETFYNAVFLIPPDCLCMVKACVCVNRAARGTQCDEKDQSDIEQTVPAKKSIFEFFQVLPVKRTRVYDECDNAKHNEKQVCEQADFTEEAENLCIHGCDSGTAQYQRKKGK